MGLGSDHLFVGDDPELSDVRGEVSQTKYSGWWFDSWP